MMIDMAVNQDANAPNHDPTTAAPAEGSSVALLPFPAGHGNWEERIKIAKEARESGSRLREGKSVTAVQFTTAPFYSS
jgi:hypothetical protein